MNGPVRVDLVLRSDVDAKGGGDAIQLRAYAEALQRRGVDVRALPLTRDFRPRPGAIVHLSNTSRPLDLLLAARAAADRPVVVTPIHHARADFARMRRAEPWQGPRTLVGRFLPEPVREWVAGAARAGTRPPLGDLPLLPGLWSRVGRVLDDAVAVTLLSDVERRTLQADTGWSGHNGVLVPNGAPETPPGDPMPWAERDGTLLVVGRVEPRKRQVEVARAAAAQGVRVRFVGAPNTATGRYVEDFRKLVEGSPTLEWAGERPREWVLTAMRSTRVLVNASWAEVQSLVDLEAITAGCLVCATRTGSTAEYFPARTTVVAEDDVEGLVRRAAELSLGRSNPVEVRPGYSFTWDSAAETLLSAYEKAATDRAPARRSAGRRVSKG